MSMRWCGSKVWRLAAAFGLGCLAGVVRADDAPRPERDYLVTGAPTSEQTPMRACDPRSLAGLQRVEIPAPAQGWSGAPQAVSVFNVFAGEVMVALGGRQVCGRMHDARTRDSRFRASVGLVAVPAAGSHEPIQLAWAAPLKPGWIPTVRLGSPSPVQQVDTLRLLVRAACLAIALALAFSALMGFIGAHDRVFLGHVATCLVLLLWQAILSGLCGYPWPWLPVGERESWWLVAFSAFGIATVLYGIWSQAGVVRLHPWLVRAAHWSVGGLTALGVAALLLPYPALRVLAVALDEAFALACVGLLLLACLSLRRRDHEAFGAIVAVAPFLAMVAADRSGSRLLIEYRVEAIQLSITWFLIVMAYALTHRYGHLRRQRDEMRALADTDALTGLPNRRAGLARLDRCIDAARAEQRPLTVGFVDIDLFKRINDDHGHALGDRVLVAVAAALSASVRERADVIRMGGEEFLVLLPGVGAATARERLEAIRHRIGAAGARLGVPGLRVTASIGLATLGPGDADAASLLRRADAAMYRAKQGGRDRVVGVPEEEDASACE